MKTGPMTGRAAAEHLYASQSGIDEVAPEHEFLHPDDPGADGSFSETSYLGFNIPEASISCEIYHWFHPRHALASGGVMIFQGRKSRSAEAEYLDYRNFMPLPDDIGSVSYATGVRIDIIAPLCELRVRFDAPDASTSFDVTMRAALPAAGRRDGKHFVQVMHVRGHLVLNGARHRVDCHFIRDRSYRMQRPDLSYPIPPTEWVAATFGDGLAFHLTGSNGEQLCEDNLRWGCIWRDGQLRTPRRLRMETQRDASGIVPVSTVIELEDSRGDRHLLNGRTIALLPMSFWPNMVTHLALCEWTYDGRTGYGDFQDVVFGPWIREHMRRPPGIE